LKNLVRKMDKGELNRQLVFAAMIGNLTGVRDALSSGADVNARDIEGIDGVSALNWAARNGKNDVVNYLIDQGADINSRDSDNYTVLRRAVIGGHVETAGLLIDRGADTEATDNNGFTPLMFAAFMKIRPIVEIFVEKDKNFSLEKLKEDLRKKLEKIKDPAKKVEMKICFSRILKEVVLCLGKETKLDAKTVKLPPKDKGTFRTMKRARC